MSDTSTIARPYAQAIFEIASRDGSLAGWAQTLNALAETVSDERASAFLSRPDVDDDVRTSFVSSVAAELGAADLLNTDHGQNLLRLLAENDRLSALPDIASRFESLKAAADNSIRVTLITATAADEDVAKRIATALETKLGRKVELEQEIDEKILGGAIVRAEDMVIDGSVKTRLRKLAELLVS